MRTIVCFGDSNSYGTPPMRGLGEWQRFGPDQRWPALLRTSLGADWHVIEEGQPGRTILHDDPIEGAHRNGRRILPALLESHRPIDLIIVMLGTNDLKARFSMSAEDVTLSMGVLLDDILKSPAGPDGHAPAVLLIAPAIVVETGPFATMFAGAAEKSRALGRFYGALAQRLGIGFLDAGTIIRVSPQEGIHFAAEQHALLAEAVHARVLEVFSGA